MRENPNNKKGQIEFVAIAGIVVIVLVAVFLTLQNPFKPSGFHDVLLSDEQRLIKDSITNMIKLASEEELTRLYEQGGYIDTGGTVNIKFGGIEVPLWSACGELSLPQVEKELGSGITEYVVKNLMYQREFYGKDIEIEMPEIKTDVNIIDKKITVIVEMPITVNNFEMPPIYEVEVKSNLKEIIEFSKDFTIDANKTRFFELITVTAMSQSTENSPSWTPLTGMVTGCGKKLKRTREQMLEGAKRMIEYTIAHTAWDRKTPRLANNIFFSINKVGEKYYDLDISFAYPSEWNNEIGEKFLTEPETLRVIAKPMMFLVPFCMANYAVAYTFQYPVIVSVKDDILNQYFRFAIYVSIKDNQPDNECKATLFSGRTEYQKRCIDNAKCDFEITVKDSYGNPLKGADITFYGCDIGVTGANGKLESGDLKAPCVMSELVARKGGYRSRGKFVTTDELMGETFELTRITPIKVKYYAIPIIGVNHVNGRYNSYNIAGSPIKINETVGMNPPNDLNISVSLRFKPIDPDIFTEEDADFLIDNLNTTNEGDVPIFEKTEDMIYPIRYNVTGVVKNMNIHANSNDNGIVIGSISEIVSIAPGQNELCVYAPAIIAKTPDFSPPSISLHYDQKKILEDMIRTQPDLSYLIGYCGPVELAGCGDGTCNPDEACDFASSENCIDGGILPAGVCRSDCTFCGDARKDAGNEQCDPSEPDDVSRSFGLGTGEDNQYSCSEDCGQEGGWCGDAITQDGSGLTIDYGEKCDYGEDNSCCEDCKWTCPPYTKSVLHFAVGDPLTSILESGNSINIDFPACRIFDETSAGGSVNVETITDATKTAIVFVTDTSGSMDKVDSGETLMRIERALNALKESLTKLNEADVNDGADISVGLVRFSGSNPSSGNDVTFYEIKDIGDQNHFNDLNSELETDIYTIPDGSTYTDLAIITAHEKIMKIDAKRRIIVLLSDGPASQPPTSPVNHDPADEAIAAKSDEIEIYTIAFGPNADDMSLWSSGEGYSFSGGDASGIYDQIISDILKQPEGILTITIGNKDSTLNIIEGLMEVDLDFSGIECSTTEKEVSISVEFDGGGSIELSDMKLQYCSYCSPS